MSLIFYGRFHSICTPPPVQLPHCANTTLLFCVASGRWAPCCYSSEFWEHHLKRGQQSQLRRLCVLRIQRLNLLESESEWRELVLSTVSKHTSHLSGNKRSFMFEPIMSHSVCLIQQVPTWKWLINGVGTERHIRRPPSLVLDMTVDQWFSTFLVLLPFKTVMLWWPQP